MGRHARRIVCILLVTNSIASDDSRLEMGAAAVMLLFIVQVARCRLGGGCCFCGSGGEY